MVTNRGLGRGFTLLELVIGITLVGIAFLLMVTLVENQGARQRAGLYQIRAAELADALIGRMQSVKFDEHCADDGSAPCSVDTNLACTSPANYGSEGSETLNSFNDIDDFANYCPASGGNALSGAQFANELGLDGSLFSGYRIEICVTSAPQWAGAIGDAAIKQVVMLVYMPDNAEVRFSGLWSNF